MRKKSIVITTFILFLSAFSMAQETNKEEEKKGFDPKKIFYGGSLGGSLGTVTFINLTPVVGYRFTDKFVAGPRLIYQYFKVRGLPSYSNYGYGLMSRYFISPRIFAQAEMQQIYIQSFGNSRFRQPSLLIGGGYMQRPVAISILYDLLWTPQSIYPNPIQFNVGLMF